MVEQYVNRYEESKQENFARIRNKREGLKPCPECGWRMCTCQQDMTQEYNVNLSNQEFAFQYLQKLLKKKYGFFFALTRYNKRRHLFLKPPPTTLSLPSFYALYKKEFFESFPKKFGTFVLKFPQYNCVGDSINKKALQIALSRKATKVVFLHPDEIYSIDTKELKKFCEDNDLVRTQDRGNFYKAKDGQHQLVNEETYSFPVKIMNSGGDVL